MMIRSVKCLKIATLDGLRGRLDLNSLTYIQDIVGIVLNF